MWGFLSNPEIRINNALPQHFYVPSSYQTFQSGMYRNRSSELEDTHASPKLSKSSFYVADFKVRSSFFGV